MKTNYIALGMIIAAMAVLIACVIVKPEDAVIPAVGLVTTVVAAMTGKLREKNES